jgi:hypothetical protein
MDFLDRIGQLNIPTGLQGSQGPAGTNGAGWTFGSTNPTTAPPASILFYLQTTSGQIFEWNGTAWVSIISTIKGTNGNVWFSGLVPPVTVPGAVANDYYLDTVLGNIYKLVGVNWVLQLNIKGQNGAPGVNGTGLLGSSVNVAGQVFTVSTSPFNLNSTITFNGQQAFPTVGSVVRSTFFVKAKYNNTSLNSRATGAEIYYIPRVVNVTTSVSFDPNTPAIDQNTSIDDRIMYGPSAIDFNYTHGRDAEIGTYIGISNSGLPVAGTSPSKQYPHAYTKIVTTLIRVGANTIRGSVEYITTTRYATYTANYEPTFGSFALDFSASGGISIEQIGSVVVPTGYPVSIEPIYHIVEKSIL